MACRRFQCHWSEHEAWDEGLRPDKCGFFVLVDLRIETCALQIFGVGEIQLEKLASVLRWAIEECGKQERVLNLTLARSELIPSASFSIPAGAQELEPLEMAKRVLDHWGLLSE
ncbi:MAG: hypothetical protein JKY65_34055 [Planctomycetes bacterium]|nr:hypothetical protein [Planctomycetota bacterium]